MKLTLLPKRTTLLVLFFIAFFQVIFSQTPPDNLSGEELKAWLRTNYYDDQHVTLGYTNAREYLYNYIDNENGVITCVYSGYQVSSPYGGTTTYPAPINCEHTVPQSFFDSADPMVSDLFHLYPTYENWNSTRSNYPFYEINDATTTKWMYLDQLEYSIPASNIDSYSEYANSQFEPREDHKGNLARSIFYFYTMYPTQAGDISLIGDINVFYQWHLDDPVDAAELERNNEIATFQGNRNPYIDYPELVATAWGFTPVDSAPSSPAIAIVEGNTSLILNWTNVSNENGYTLYRSIDATNFDLIADIAANTSTYTDTDVIEGLIYYYYVVAYNDFGISDLSNVIEGQLNTSVNLASDLLFSEYIEGSSYNKALEIANFTGNTVDLSNYTIKKQTNGTGDWGSPLTLTGSLVNGDVYVVAHSSADAEIQAVADVSINTDVTIFNGNDAIGLFKNGTLIDIIGEFNSAVYFAQDVTLLRNQDVTSPNTTYTTSEWTMFPIDTFSDLGTHTIDGGTPVEDTEAPSIPTALAYLNLTSTSLDLTWTASSDNVSVTGYDIYQDGVMIGSSTTTDFSVSGLTASTDYAFTVLAKDEAGNTSDFSVALTVTTLSDLDTEAPTVPTALAYLNLTSTSLDLTWTASTDNVGVTGYDIYQDGVMIGNSTTTDFSVSGLTASTDYAFTVLAKDEAGNISDFSVALTVITLTDIVSYCDSYGLDSSGAWLDQVVVADLSNTSGNDNGYGDYMSITANLSVNGTYDIALYQGYGKRTNRIVYSIWIDFNQDYSFDPVTELVYNVTSRDYETLGSFTVPSSALTGETRMRIAMKYNKEASPCEVFDVGEVEDYIVSITGDVVTSKAKETNSLQVEGISTSVYPNPANEFATLRLSSANETNLSYAIIDIQGRLILSKENINVYGIYEENIDVTELKTGMYILMIYNDEMTKQHKLIVE